MFRHVEKNLLIIIALIGLIEGDTHLGDACVDDWSCSHIVDAECSGGVCSCTSNTIAHDGACVQVSKPERLCTSDSECKLTVDERRICVSNKCRCIPYHHVLDEICTKNRGLHERCLRDEECYWGQDMVDKIVCKGQCSCKSGYRPFHGRKCISSANKNAVIPLSAIVTFVLISMALS